jgi:hypothetical protein
MIPREAEGVSRCQPGRVDVGIVSGLVAGTVEGGGELPFVARAGMAAMPGQMFLVKREDNLELEPNPALHRKADLFREFAKRRAALFENSPPYLHLLFEFRIVWGNAETVRRFGQENRIAFLRLEAGEHLARQDDPGRIADRGELKLVHGSVSGVITKVIT